MGGEGGRGKGGGEGMTDDLSKVVQDQPSLARTARGKSTDKNANVTASLMMELV